MTPVLRDLAQGKYVRVKSLADQAGVTAALIYSEIKRDPSGVVRIGNAVCVKPARARKLLGLDEQAAE